MSITILACASSVETASILESVDKSNLFETWTTGRGYVFDTDIQNLNKDNAASSIYPLFEGGARGLSAYVNETSVEKIKRFSQGMPVPTLFVFVVYIAWGESPIDVDVLSKGSAPYVLEEIQTRLKGSPVPMSRDSRMSREEFEMLLIQNPQTGEVNGAHQLLEEKINKKVTAYGAMTVVSALVFGCTLSLLSSAVEDSQEPRFVGRMFLVICSITVGLSGFATFALVANSYYVVRLLGASGASAAEKYMSQTFSERHLSILAVFLTAPLMFIALVVYLFSARESHGKKELHANEGSGVGIMAFADWISAGAFGLTALAVSLALFRQCVVYSRFVDGMSYIPLAM